MVDLALPRLKVRSLTVWKRNALVWQKLIGPSLMINFGEPTLYLLGLGYGLGMFIGKMAGMDYLTFLASGVITSYSIHYTKLYEAAMKVNYRNRPCPRK